MRSAVDAYLAGGDIEQLQLLDAATRQAESVIGEMNVLLEESNRRAALVFAELDKLRRPSSQRRRK